MTPLALDLAIARCKNHCFHNRKITNHRITDLLIFYEPINSSLQLRRYNVSLSETNK